MVTHEFTVFQQNPRDDESPLFLRDPDVTNKLSNCIPLSAVVSSDYQAVFYIGGKVFDFPDLVCHSDCQLRTLTLCRVWASCRSGEGPYKCSTCFRGEVTFATLTHPAVVSGILTIECPALAVLGGRRVGRWRLPWARVSGCASMRFSEVADHGTILAPGSSPKIRTENLSSRERKSPRFPMRKKNSRLRWVLG